MKSTTQTVLENVEFQSQFIATAEVETKNPTMMALANQVGIFFVTLRYGRVYRVHPQLLVCLANF